MKRLLSFLFCLLFVLYSFENICSQTTTVLAEMIEEDTTKINRLLAKIKQPEPQYDIDYLQAKLVDTYEVYKTLRVTKSDTVLARKLANLYNTQSQDSIQKQTWYIYHTYLHSKENDDYIAQQLEQALEHSASGVQINKKMIDHLFWLEAKKDTIDDAQIKNDVDTLKKYIHEQKDIEYKLNALKSTYYKDINEARIGIYRNLYHDFSQKIKKNNSIIKKKERQILKTLQKGIQQLLAKYGRNIQSRKGKARMAMETMYSYMEKYLKPYEELIAHLEEMNTIIETGDFNKITDFKSKIENLKIYTYNKNGLNFKKGLLNYYAILNVNDSLKNINQQLTLNNQQLWNENEQLNTDNEQLNQENNELVDENGTLAQKNRTLAAKNTQFQQQNQILSVDNRRLLQNNRALIRQNTQLNNNNNQLITQNQILNTQNQSLNTQNQSLNTQNQLLNTKNQTLNKDNQTLTQQKKQLTTNNQTLAAKNTLLSKKNINLSEQNTQLDNENHTLVGENRQLNNNNLQLNRLNDTLNLNNEYLIIDNQKLNLSNEYLIDQNTDLSNFNEVLSTEKQSLIQTNQSLANKKANLIAVNQSLHNKKSVLNDVNISLQEKKEILERKKNKLKQQQDSLEVSIDSIQKNSAEELNYTHLELDNTYSELHDTYTDLDNTCAELDHIHTELDNTYSHLKTSQIVDVILGIATAIFLIFGLVTLQLFLVAQKRKKTLKWLLKEINHRYGNALQHMIYVLKKRQRRSKNEDVKQALQSTKEQIYNMGIVHQQLYNYKALGTNINIGQYIQNLITNLQKVYTIPDQPKVKTTYQLNDMSLNINIEDITTIGLIISEIVTNSFKYAFPKHPAPKLYTSLQKQDNNTVLLIIKDNGQGLPDDTELKNKNSLGFKIIHTLVSDLYKGKITVNNEQGACYHISFVPQ